MPTRAEQAANSIDNLAMKRYGVFILILAVCALSGLAFACLAAQALTAGPIGVALKDPLFGFGPSRLSVLQFSTFFALILFTCFVVLVVSWRHAPLWLRILCGAKIMRRVSRYLHEEPNAGEAWFFWAAVSPAVLWVNVALLDDLPLIACIEPDTIGYLQPSALRSAGYMLFIKAVMSLGGDLKWIVPLQLNAMLLGFVSLGWAARGLMRSQGVGLAVALAPILSSSLMILAPSVMSEALFVALICLHFAAVLCVLRKPGWMALGLAGLTLGLMIVVRPNGISFLVGIPLLVYMCWEHWRRVLFALVFPVAVLVGAQGIYNYQVFGFFGLHKFGGISLAGNAAPLIRADMPTDFPNLAKRLEQNLAVYYGDFPPFEDRAYPFEMAHVASLTAVGAIYQQILPAIREKLNLPEPKAVAFEFDPRMNAIAGSLALSAIQNDPWGFLKIVTSNYIANWHATLPVRVPMSIYYPRCLDHARGLVAQYPSRLSQFIGMSNYDDEGLVTEVAAVGGGGVRGSEGTRVLISIVQLPLAYLALLVSFGGLVFIFWRGRAVDGDYRALTYAALSLQAGYGLISLGNASFTRYTVVFDPVVILLLSAGAVMLRRYMFSQGADARTQS